MSDLDESILLVIAHKELHKRIKQNSQETGEGFSVLAVRFTIDER
jgi:hypothetical protein